MPFAANDYIPIIRLTTTRIPSRRACRVTEKKTNQPACMMTNNLKEHFTRVVRGYANTYNSYIKTVISLSDVRLMHWQIECVKRNTLHAYTTLYRIIIII